MMTSKRWECPTLILPRQRNWTHGTGKDAKKKIRKEGKDAVGALEGGSVSMSFLVGILEGGIHLMGAKMEIRKKQKRFTNTLPETNSSHLPKNHVKRNLFFQAAFFRCELLVLGRISWGVKSWVGGWYT